MPSEKSATRATCPAVWTRPERVPVPLGVARVMGASMVVSPDRTETPDKTRGKGTEEAVIRISYEPAGSVIRNFPDFASASALATAAPF
jgi:hypothetical protein